MYWKDLTSEEFLIACADVLNSASRWSQGSSDILSWWGFSTAPVFLQTKQQTGSPLVWLGLLLLYFLRNESSAIIRPEAGTGWLAGTPQNSGESEGNECDNTHKKRRRGWIVRRER